MVTTDLIGRARAGDGEAFGLQTGLWNEAKTISGLQVGLVNLADAVLATQVASGVPPTGPGIRANYATSGADVSGNGKIGMEEVIYILQALAGLR